MIEVIVKKTELPIAGNVALRPGLWVWLIATHDEPTHFFLEIGAAVGIADGGSIGSEPRNTVSDDVLVLDRLERNIDAGHGAHLSCPHAGAVHHLLAGDCALARPYRGDPAILDVKTVHRNIFNQLRAIQARTFGERLGNVGWTCLAVRRQPACAHKVRDIHERPHLLHFRRGDEVHVHAEASGGRGEALELGPAVIVGGEPQAARHLPAGFEARLVFEALVEIDRILEHARDRGRRAELAHQACCMPCGAGCDPVLLEQHHIGLVFFGEVIGRGTADDAAADHNDLRVGW